MHPVPMRRQPRSEDRRIARKSSATAAALAAEIGSRVLPFRPPPASMPTVGARRSTKVFVPKAAAAATAAKARDAAPRAKRLALPKSRADDWYHVFGPSNGSSGVNGWWNGDAKKMKGLDVGVVGWSEPTAAVPAKTALNGAEEPKQLHEPVELESSAAAAVSPKMFAIFYTRKRRRSQPGESSYLKDMKYGIVYVRKRQRKKPKLESLAESFAEQAVRIIALRESPTEAATKLVITESTRNIAYERAGISGDELSACSGGPVVLAVLIESPRSSGACWFANILASIMKWMGRSGLKFWGLATLLFSGSLAGVFSLHGIHFLPIQQQKMTILSRNAVLGCGLCKLYGAAKTYPMLTIDFSSVPLYFKRLHASLFLASEYLPAVLARNLTASIQSEGYDSHVPAGTVFSRTEIKEITVSATPVLCMTETSELFAQNTVVPVQSPRNPQKKRSKLRPDRNCVIVSLPAASCSLRNSLKVPVHVKPQEERLADLVDVRVEDDDPSPSGAPQKYKKTEVTKEQKLALSEVKQNIDSVRCNANILVIDSDKCWREEGAEITMVTLDSEQWCIAVKADGAIRYLHKPQELRPCNINRYTRAYMWIADDSWRLEFSDRWEWLVFKELHMECCVRNKQDVPVKIIPVPGVHEVFGYDGITSSFVRPSMFIQTRDNEVERALASNIANYDMDSGDEEWVKQLNSSALNSEHDDLEKISNDNFERMIFTFEKDAFSNPDDILNKERALAHCQNFGKRDLVASVFDYWLKKRNKRRASLVRVFQFPPAKRLQFMNNSFLRKKRSFSRQRSQGGRGKPEFFLPGGAKQQEAMQKVKQAEILASEALQKAIYLRTRAQMYMTNAELSAYKSVMAHRIAEAKKVTGSQDFVSSILD